MMKKKSFHRNLKSTPMNMFRFIYTYSIGDNDDDDDAIHEYRISCCVLIYSGIVFIDKIISQAHATPCDVWSKEKNTTYTALMAENRKNEWIYVFSVECLWWAPFNMQCSRFHVMRWCTCMSNEVVQVYFDTNTMMKWKYGVGWLVGDRIPLFRKKSPQNFEKHN